MNGELRLRLVGDVMLGRCVDETIGRRGFRYPWGDVLRILIQVDLLICNLETTLTECRRSRPCWRGIPQTRERRSLKSTGAQLASLVDQEMSARLRAIGSYAGNVKPVREFCDCPL
jgi:hypothetical protein